jgi:hypothetical protein
LKRWLALAIVWLTFLTGCRGAPPSAVDAPVTDGFTCEADITYKDTRLAGTLSRAGAGTLKLAFSAPDTLKGITVEWQGDAVTASLYGLSFSLSEQALPAGALGRVLIDALDAASRSSDGVRITGAALTWTGAGQNGAVTLTADPADGRLLSLEMPGVPLKATFSGFHTTS